MVFAVGIGLSVYCSLKTQIERKRERKLLKSRQFRRIFCGNSEADGAFFGLARTLSAIFEVTFFKLMNTSELFCRELAHALLECSSRGRFANSVIQKKFSTNRHWTEEERSLFAESLYFMLRNLLRLQHAVGITLSDDLQSHLRIVLAALLMHRIHSPTHMVKQARIDAIQLQQRWKEAESDRRLCYSVPEWIDELGLKSFGGQWEPLLRALHDEPKITLRTNTLKAKVEDLDLAFQQRKIKTLRSALSPDALTILQFLNVFVLDEFRKGFFEVQDAGSQCIAPFCDLSEGMRVIDACAGSGGKTLHMAALMNNKGRIISMDTEQWKLDELSKRARRDGVSIVETRCITSTKVVKRLSRSADRVLLDVPCSGLGVLRRNPDTKWHLQPADIDRFITMQRDILQQYAGMMKEDGKLIYATCSILPAECEDQVQWFLQKNPEWILEEERRLLPHIDQCDGFYMARLRLANPSAAASASPVAKKPKKEKVAKVVADETSVITAETEGATDTAALKVTEIDATPAKLTEAAQLHDSELVSDQATAILEGLDSNSTAVSESEHAGAAHSQHREGSA